MRRGMVWGLFLTVAYALCGCAQPGVATAARAQYVPIASAAPASSASLPTLAYLKVPDGADLTAMYEGDREHSAYLTRGKQLITLAQMRRLPALVAKGTNLHRDDIEWLGIRPIRYENPIIADGAMGVTRAQSQGTATRWLSGLFDAKYIAHPIARRVPAWDVDGKRWRTSAATDALERQMRTHEQRYAHRVDGLEIDNLYEGLSVELTRDGTVLYLTACWYDYAASKARTTALPLADAMRAADAAIREDVGTAVYMLTADLVYSNLASSSATRYDLHWRLETSDGTVYVNCATKEVWRV